MGFINGLVIGLYLVSLFFSDDEQLFDYSGLYAWAIALIIILCVSVIFATLYSIVKYKTTFAKVYFSTLALGLISSFFVIFGQSMF